LINLSFAPCPSDCSWFLSAACGQPEVKHTTRLTGWQEADEGEWPWTVSIRRNRVHVCGGSLISSQWVVTAAFDGREVQDMATLNLMRVLNVGEYELTAPSAAMFSSNVNKIIIHPFYAGVGLSADIALVQLANAVRFSKMIMPVCLPNTFQPFVFYGGMMCWIAGWGVDTDHLLFWPFPHFSGANRNGHHNGDPVSFSWQGDSGGPLVCQQNDIWFLTGVSITFGCVESSQPGIYTLVTSFMDWIEDTTHEKLLGADPLPGVGSCNIWWRSPSCAYWGCLQTITLKFGSWA
uniref:Peptidase S1 domain-containing protein n=1 Tax=Podarcis muralis TaxID=64176 RepID=A0A670KC85_PODMU